LFVAKKAEGVQALEQLKVDLVQEAQTAQNDEIEMAAAEALVGGPCCCLQLVNLSNAP
jgi:hypothetical protein